MTQQELSLPERAKADAIAQVEARNLDFIEVACDCIEFLSSQRSTVTSLDVWAMLAGHAPSPTNPRAMGAAFVRAHRLGLITPTNQWVPSGRVSDHNQQLRVWRSEVYR